LTTLDIGFNRFTGTLPSTIGRMTNLERVTAPANFFVGTLPSEMGMLSNLGQINLTSNQFTGTVPKELCDYSDEESTLMKQFGCDAILCPSGTYHPEGAASVHGGAVLVLVQDPLYSVILNAVLTHSKSAMSMEMVSFPAERF